MVSSYQHIQFGHCLGWVSRKQLSERLLQSLEVGLVRSKLNHILSFGGESTLITAGAPPTRMLSTTSSPSLFWFQCLWTKPAGMWKKTPMVRSAIFRPVHNA